MSTSPTSPPTNLPDPSFTPVLTSYVTREIDAPLETVWEILSDFPKYPDWSVLTLSVSCRGDFSCLINFWQESVRVRRNSINRG